MCDDEQPSCEPMVPYPQVIISCPPPCCAPTAPQYVKPLESMCMPQGVSGQKGQARDPEEEFRLRIANFYNNYNVNYLAKPKKGDSPKIKRDHGQNVDGKLPECYPESSSPAKPKQGDCSGTGFKPCNMKLCPSDCSDPLSAWSAQIQDCPTKSPQVSSKKGNKYIPGECTRPGCKHWKSKMPCSYGKTPCKGHCYDHPPGMKSINSYTRDVKTTRLHPIHLNLKNHRVALSISRCV